MINLPNDVSMPVDLHQSYVNCASRWRVDGSWINFYRLCMNVMFTRFSIPLNTNKQTKHQNITSPYRSSHHPFIFFRNDCRGLHGWMKLPHSPRFEGPTWVSLSTQCSAGSTWHGMVLTYPKITSFAFDRDSQEAPSPQTHKQWQKSASRGSLCCRRTSGWSCARICAAVCALDLETRFRLHMTDSHAVLWKKWNSRYFQVLFLPSNDIGLAKVSWGLHRQLPCPLLFLIL